jgi:glycosyltransferase involved in cell wall biosynthesis
MGEVLRSKSYVLRVGVMGHDLTNWAGGLDYLRLVCAALNATGVELELHFLLPDQGPRAWTRRFALRLLASARHLRGRTSGIDFAPSREIILASVANSVGAVQVHRLDLGTGALASVAARLSLDVLLPVMNPLPPAVGVPWLACIYDFQHIHLPQYFTDKERAKRDKTFARLLNEAPVVVFNSAAVLADAQRFLPSAKAKLLKLPSSAAPVGDWFHTDIAQAQARHCIDKRYFIVCNQFWLHKGHRTAFHAFAQLAKEQPDLLLVCTGSTSDPRNPRYLQDLMEDMQRLGLADRVRVLGLIPKQDQIALLRGALALVQPTLFEGTPGGLAAYDAVALGVPALVSDIAVNLELDEPCVRFFRADDADDLYRLMLERLMAGPAPKQSVSELLQNGDRRRAAFGQGLLQAIDCARR